MSIVAWERKLSPRNRLLENKYTLKSIQIIEVTGNFKRPGIPVKKCTSTFIYLIDIKNLLFMLENYFSGLLYFIISVFKFCDET